MGKDITPKDDVSEVTVVAYHKKNGTEYIKVKKEGKKLRVYSRHGSKGGNLASPENIEFVDKEA